MTVGRRVAALLLLVGIWLTGSAHVGNTLVVQDGTAGPYGLRVLVRPPAVIPGLVDVVIRSTTPQAVPSNVTLQPALWRYGTKGAPAPEPAVAVPGEPGTFQTQVWIMSSGSYALHIAASGAAGTGTFIVPYTSVATATLAMPEWLGWVLAALGAFLVLGLASVIGAASREATLPVGVAPDTRRRRRARFATAIASLITCTMVFGGWTWWTAVDRDYKRSLYRPLDVETGVSSGAPRTLTMRISDSTWRVAKPGEPLRNSFSTPLMPDHGKMMHMFLVAAGARGAVAHLHPVRIDDRTFATPLHGLPAGTYWMFADVVHESGYTRTFVDTVSVASGDARPNADGDDALALAPPSVTASPATLSDGAHFGITLEGTPAVGRDVVIHTQLTNADGTAATLLPWLGMAGHAMLVRTDGGVFMHLHPLGTSSMAAQDRLVRREAGDTAMHGDAQPMDAAMDMAGMHASPIPGDVRFPVAFPSAGTYRIFVQLRRASGRIETAALDVTVR
ncbi:MAG: hypothetical protein H7099_13010 [Gemmatimonadaceae bacterium]|nr:hypothetical protein [Gemmatimonadaceae bacterium]